MRNRRQSGFTLIELLVVVAIIGILASIALPKLFAAICTSKEGQATGTISALNSAISVYYGRNEGLYPNHPTGNDINVTGTTDIFGGTAYNFGQYYATNPNDPWSSGQDYKYQGLSATGYTISIKAVGGNGCDGITSTDDCIIYSSALGKVQKVSTGCL